MTNRKIIEYGIAAGENYKELAGLVNKAIKHGFQPFEKPFVANHSEQVLIHQAMVRYDNLKKPATKRRIVK